MQSRTALILAAGTVALGAILAGCGGGEDSFTARDATASTATTVAGSDTTVLGNETTTTAGVSSGLGSKDASADVTDVQIVRTDDGYFPTVEVQATVTNNSEKRSSYWVTIAVESPDGATRYEETYVSVDNLEPGQATQQTTMLFEDEIPADAVAVVKEVERLASP